MVLFQRMLGEFLKTFLLVCSVLQATANVEFDFSSTVCFASALSVCLCFQEPVFWMGFRGFSAF